MTNLELLNIEINKNVNALAAYKIAAKDLELHEDEDIASMLGYLSEAERNLNYAQKNILDAIKNLKAFNEKPMY